MARNSRTSPPLLPRGNRIPALIQFGLPSLWEIAWGTPAPLSRAAGRFLRELRPSPRILDAENIPAQEPFILVFNHYESERIAAWWVPLVIAHTVRAHRTQAPYEVSFIMSSEWVYPRGWRRLIKQPFTRWAFARLAHVYGAVTVPSILLKHQPRSDDLVRVRRALALTRGATPALVGISPEGQTGPGGALCEPPRGAGLFLWMLARHDLPLLPVGAYEQDEVLVLRFGSLFHLQEPRTHERAKADRMVVNQVMTRLARLLPQSLRGMYNEDTGVSNHVRHSYSRDR